MLRRHAAALMVLLPMLGSACAEVHRANETPQVRMEEPFQVAVGSSVTLHDADGPAGVVVFSEVLEDSRCPTGVECVWEGRARILLSYRANGDEQSLELVLAGMRPEGVPPEEAEPALAGDRAFRLLRLDPYPDATPREQPEAVATLLVSAGDIR